MSLELLAQVSHYRVIQDMGGGNLGNTLSDPIEVNLVPVVYEQYFIDVNSFAVGGSILKIETLTGAVYFKKVFIK